MGKVSVVMLVLAYASISAVRGESPAWWDGPQVPGVTKYCMNQEMATLPSGERDRLSKNMGGCTCAESKEFMRKIQALTGESDISIPECDASGQWKPKQTAGKLAACVDQSGNQITKWKSEPVAC